MAGIQLNRDTQLNTDGQTTADQPHAQLSREAVRSQPTNTMGMQGHMNQAQDSRKTMEHIAVNITSEAARSTKELAQGVANIAQGKHLKEQ